MSERPRTAVPVTPWQAREHDLLVAVQRRTSSPVVRAVATGLSHLGEHAGAWLVVSAVGVVVDPRRRQPWARAGVAVFCSHAASVVLKRVARRHRPEDERLLVLVGIPSRWSMPSSHATSTTTAAIAFGGVLGSRVPLVLVPAMALSRLVLGVHYPSDVAAGVALGAAVGAWARRGTRVRA